MQLEIALKTYFTGPNTLVVLPVGVPHRNWNAGPDVESHLAVLAPAPDPGGHARHSLEGPLNGRVIA